jgi:Holliday junction resolvase RusA-like endonuclease
MHITIPLDPKTKKNSQRILTNKRTGRSFVAPSEEYKLFESAAGWYVKRPQEPIREAVNVRCEYYMKTHRRVDLVNLLEATLDILVKYGVLADDNCAVVVSMDGSRVLYDKQHPRTEIEITPCGGTE